MARGELCTSYVKLNGATPDDLRTALEKAYANEPFVHVVKKGVLPQTQNVRGSNYVQIGVVADRIKNRAIVISTLDNLVKGSAGQAIQNMNLMFGLPERRGWSRSRCFHDVRCRGGRSDAAILPRKCRGLCQAHVHLAPGAADGVSGAASAGRLHSRTWLRRRW